jgi:hypothetical protein
MLILVVLALVAVVAAADETDEEPKPVSKEVGLALAHCHPGDTALIHVIPIPENEVRRQGWFSTTNDLMTMGDFSMLPSGLNRLEIRPVCRGLTGEVSTVVIDLKRPPPPIKVGSRRVRPPVSTNSIVPTRFNASSTPDPIPLPPMPPGMASSLPLPDEQHGASTNKMSYRDMQIMKNYYAKQGRRSQ